MDNPHLSDCCGQHHCEACLLQWMKSPNGRMCPHCRDEGFNHMHDKQLGRVISQLEVRCPNLNHGCHWTGCLTNLEAHLSGASAKECEYQIVGCQFNCGETLQRRLLAEHVRSDCKLRATCCEHCGIALKQCQLDQHVTQCDQVPEACPEGCHCVMKRCDLDHHLSSDCAKRKVACLFHDVGCDVVMQRDLLGEHVDQCKDRLLVRGYENMVSAMHRLKLEVEGLRSERTQTLSRMDHLNQELKMCYDNTEYLKQQNIRLKSVLLNELEFLHAPCKPCESLSIECFQTSLQDQVVFLKPAGYCATFRLMDYLMHKESGRVWYSPSFYIGQGYRFGLAFHLNGVGIGKGTHVAVYLHQVVGQFDSHLTWPFFFEQDLKISLMWQERPKDLSKSTVKLQPPAPSVHLRLNNSHSSCRASEACISTLEREEFRRRSLSSHSRESPSLAAHKTPTRASGMYVAECQVMRVSRTLKRPLKSTCAVSQTIAKLELFCLQKIFSNVVFLDSVVLKCELVMENRSNVPPVRLDDIGWTKWTSDRM